MSIENVTPKGMDLSQFEVHSKRQIVALLEAVRDKKQLLTINVEGSSVNIITAVIDIEEERNALVLDCSKEDHLNKRMVDSNVIAVQGMLDHIKITFTANNVRLCKYDNKPAILVDIPSLLMRFQRREFYRVVTPITNPAKCSLVLNPDKPTDLATFVLKNISVGGLMLVDEKMTVDSTSGLVYPDCLLLLPKIDPIRVSLEVRNSHSAILQNGNVTNRIGMKFVNLSSKNLNSVQKYINKLELDFKASLPD